jgi:hypothetical protein
LPPPDPTHDLIARRFAPIIGQRSILDDFDQVFIGQFAEFIGH